MAIGEFAWESLEAETEYVMECVTRLADDPTPAQRQNLQASILGARARAAQWATIYMAAADRERAQATTAGMGRLADLFARVLPPGLPTPPDGL